MFNVKWGLFAGLAGLILAFLTSLLLARVSLPVALLRAFIFGMLFFGLGGGIWMLINIFIPELLDSSSKGRGNAADNVFSAQMPDAAAGSQVNITVGDDAPNAALPGNNYNTPTGEDLGNFNDLIVGSIAAAKDIDQSSLGGYTDTEESGGFAPAFESVKLGELGDFSLDFGAFFSEGEELGSNSEENPFSFFPDDNKGFGSSSDGFEEAPPPEKKYSRNKPMELKGDFDPKEIAAGLRTVLEKDKKG